MNITADENLYGIKTNVEKQSSKINEAFDGENGEPDNHKENPDNCILTGSSIMSGGGKAVICSVGNNTLLARRRKQAKIVLRQAKTFYEDKLETASDQLGKYCIVATLSIAVVASINMIFQIAFNDDKEK